MPHIGTYSSLSIGKRPLRSNIETIMSSLSAEGYGALADLVDLSDITSNRNNRSVLRRLINNNDPGGWHLRLREQSDYQWDFDATTLGYCDYAIEDARGMGVLGYYVGRSTSLKELEFTLPVECDMGIIKPFLLGLASNRSIQRVNMRSSHIPSSDFFLMLTPFIADNPNLVTFQVHVCWMDIEQYHSLSSALWGSTSLKSFSIGGLYGVDHSDHEGAFVYNIEALKMHPQLEQVHFYGFTLGRNACAALSDLLRQSGGVQKLRLDNNNIDDSGAETLVEGLAHFRGLRELDLSGNPSITVRGWGAIASLLEDPNSSLTRLHLRDSGINDESAVMFANALAHNCTLKGLFLESDVECTGKGSEGFAKVLCDTSSVNGTFLSNHTLQSLTGPGSAAGASLPGIIASLLTLNRECKKQAVIKKILLYHDDFDMQPLFEWDLKVLPFVVSWFERIVPYRIQYESRTQKRKLSAIYQFIRGMPELAIEGRMIGLCTRWEPV